MNSSPQANPTLNFELCALLFVFAEGESIFILYSLFFMLYSLLFDKMHRILSNSLNPPRSRPNPDRILNIVHEDFAISHVAFRGII